MAKISRNQIIAIVLLVKLPIIPFIIMLILYLNYTRDLYSPPFKALEEYIWQSGQIVECVGEVRSLNKRILTLLPMPGRYMIRDSENGGGEAEIYMWVEGSRDSKEIHFTLEKSRDGNSEWIVKEMDCL